MVRQENEMEYTRSKEERIQRRIKSKGRGIEVS
jgi:hypothetical protein